MITKKTIEEIDKFLFKKDKIKSVQKRKNNFLFKLGEKWQNTTQII